MTYIVDSGSFINEMNNLKVNTVGITKTIRSFWDEMSSILSNYSALTLNPDASKTLQIGDISIPGDQITSPATSMLLEDRLSKIQQAQNALIDIFDFMRKSEQKLYS